MNFTIKNTLVLLLFLFILYAINLFIYFSKIKEIKKVLDKIKNIVDSEKNTSDYSFKEKLFSIAPEINALSGTYNHISRNTTNLTSELLYSIDSLKDKLDYARYNFKINLNPLYFIKKIIIFILNIPSSFVKLFGFKLKPKTSKILNILIWIILVILDAFISHYVESFINHSIQPLNHFFNNK